ncbi:MAG: helix-turn-helix domain-containing protein [Rhizobiaceae bacterium]|nr:helix-turn-helix domain-containing protein [Rhizobiaceae bacterium]
MYGNNLRKAREERGLNLDQAADLTGIKKTSLWRLESGDSKVSVERFFAIADAYGFDPIDLLKDKTSTGMTEADYDRVRQVVVVVLGLLEGTADSPNPDQIAAAVSEVLRLENRRYAEQSDAEFGPERYERLIQAIMGGSTSL